MSTSLSLSVVPSIGRCWSLALDPLCLDEWLWFSEEASGVPQPLLLPDVLSREAASSAMALSSAACCCLQSRDEDSAVGGYILRGFSFLRCSVSLSLSRRLRWRASKLSALHQSWFTEGASALARRAPPSDR
uniref:Uncharacterized protein n=1 Tax=Ixodes ricinus TaxID=34613 RepID=A0A6B0URD9_IXORI